MGLERVLAAIRESGSQAVQRIRSDAEAEAAQILEQAKQGAQSCRTAILAEAEDQATRESSRLLHQTKLEALQRLAQAQERLARRTREQVRARLAALRRQSGYPHLLSELIEEAIDELISSAAGVGRIRLQVDDRDLGLAQAIASRLSSKVLVEGGLESWGGGVARSEDGRVSIDNTLEARLSMAEPELIRLVLASGSRELSLAPEAPAEPVCDDLQPAP